MRTIIALLIFFNSFSLFAKGENNYISFTSLLKSSDVIYDVKGLEIVVNYKGSSCSHIYRASIKKVLKGGSLKSKEIDVCVDFSMAPTPLIVFPSRMIIFLRNKQKGQYYYPAHRIGWFLSTILPNSYINGFSQIGITYGQLVDKVIENLPKEKK